MKSHNIKISQEKLANISCEFFQHLNFFIISFFLDYQEKYQELLEREDFFPDYEENGTDLSGAGDP